MNDTYMILDAWELRALGYDVPEGVWLVLLDYRSNVTPPVDTLYIQLE